MSFKKMFVVGLLTLAASNSQAAIKDYDVKYRQAVREDNRFFHETRRQSYNFRVEVVNDSEGVKPESYKDGRPFITATKGERYSVRLYNPMPVRVAVNLTVDGLNSISGQPSGIADGQKWVLDPYSTVTIPGWQVSGGEARRFFFTDKPKSYAKWRGDVTGKDLSANCGVIGAAYFWNQRELNDYYDAHPIIRYTQRRMEYSAARAKSSESMAGSASGAPSAAPALQDYDMKKEMRADEPEEKAGTGMGERESHPTVQVNFDYNRGMYSLDQALVIYYDFAHTPSPNPFPAIGFAPEM